jgi:hypothetical protein
MARLDRSPLALSRWVGCSSLMIDHQASPLPFDHISRIESTPCLLSIFQSPCRLAILVRHYSCTPNNHSKRLSLLFMASHRQAYANVRQTTAAKGRRGWRSEALSMGLGPASEAASGSSRHGTESGDLATLCGSCNVDYFIFACNP